MHVVQCGDVQGVRQLTAQRVQLMADVIHTTHHEKQRAMVAVQLQERVTDAHAGCI